MKIRLATTEDMPAIRQIAYETWPVTYGKIQSKEQLDYMLELIYNLKALKEQFENGHLFLVAEGEDGHPVGFAGTSEIEPGKSWKLHKLYVLPGIQKSGAGRALMQAVIDAAKARNATELVLNVNRSNPAYNYYLKNGFEVAEKVDIPIGGGFFMNDYVMRKSI